MKLRMKNNSVRLRLTQNEVARFAETGRVEEKIEFGIEPHQNLVYALEINADIKEIQARFEVNRLTIMVPKMRAENWIDPAQIGITAEQQIGGEKSLHLLIEKDFVCLEPRAGEDDADAFPHPPQVKSC